MEKILYYVEAWIESPSDLRFGAFQDAVYQLDLLKKHAPELDCRLLIGDGVREAILKANYKDHSAYITSILHTEELRSVFRDHRSAAHAFMSRSLSTNELDALINLTHSALGDFVPDVILMHETHAPFLNAAYPNALVLHSMYGMTYRMPYPRLTLFDPEGLYQNSLLAQHTDEIRKIPIPEKDQYLLGEIRNWYAAQIIPHDPVWHLIEPEQSRYEKLLLLPLQVDGYFGFEECSAYTCQVEFLEDVLEKTPRNWGVVVTEHSEYKPALDKLTVNRLRRLYPNLIYSEKINSIPYVSQALLAHVDAVITVSSSLALQSLIFDCPVVAAGTSHINAVATCSLDQLHLCFDLHRPGYRDGLLHFILTRYHQVTSKHVHDGGGLFILLNQRYQAFKAGLVGLDTLPERSLTEVLEEAKGSSQWRSWSSTLKNCHFNVHPHPVLSRMVFSDAVSFDLFDTLVDRPFVQPHELFQFMEPMVREITGNLYFPFHHLRCEAERKAREAHGHRIEVTLAEIYGQLELTTGLPRSLLDTIQALEVRVETALIGPRRGMVRAWKLARTWGKWRSILTDIYLDESTIQSLLDAHGLSDHDLLFVSAKERIRKDDGTVYPEYLARVRQLDPCVSSFLHIGDNARADGEMARKFGIETVVIPKAMDHLRRTEIGAIFKNALEVPSFDSSIYLGLVANRFFTAPSSFHKSGSFCDGNLFNIGFSVLGPFVLGYVQWLIRRMQAHKVDHAYFLARDGYLIMKVYEAMKRVLPDLPDHSYLYCSRRSVMVPGIRNEENIFEIATLNYGTTTIQNFLKSRYGLNARDLPSQILRKHGIKPDGSTLIGYPRDLALTIRLVTDIKPWILDRAKLERKTYLRYLKSMGACDRKQRSAFVDIGYSGTMQRKISELTGIRYNGYYMLTHNYVLHHFRDQVFEAWLEEYDSQRSAYKHPFNHYIPLIESLLSSTEGSFICFQDRDDELVPEFLHASNERERRAFVEGLHAGAMAFVNDYLRLFGSFAGAFELSPQVASFPLFRFGDQPSQIDISPFVGLTLENLFAGAEFSVIASPYRLMDQKGHLSGAAVDHLLNESKWKQGARVAYRGYVYSQKGPPQDVEPQSAVEVPAVDGIPADTTGVQISRKNRLLRKLRINPERFFADSRIPGLRPLRYLFSNPITGYLATSAVRRLI
ncbi:MAG: hypothetical protein ACOVPA_16280 [Rubrivivax sp.]